MLVAHFLAECGKVKPTTVNICLGFGDVLQEASFHNLLLFRSSWFQAWKTNIILVDRMYLENSLTTYTGPTLRGFGRIWMANVRYALLFPFLSWAFDTVCALTVILLLHPFLDPSESILTSTTNPQIAFSATLSRNGTVAAISNR